MAPDGSELPIRVAQWLGPGSWRDSFGNVAPAAIRDALRLTREKKNIIIKKNYDERIN